MDRISRCCFHASRTLLSGWKPQEDAKLLKRYEKIGPSWTMLAMQMPSRSPEECRRRYLRLSGQLEGLPAETARLIYIDGYEMHNGELMMIPRETVVSNPFQKAARAVDPVRFRSQRKRQGWTPMERIAVREGFEQLGPSWDTIARSLQYRTGPQVRNFMLRQSVCLLTDKQLIEAAKSLYGIE